MKRISLILSLVLLCGLLNAQEDWGKLSFYAAANDSVKAINDPERVVFMGNSIIYYWQEFHPEFWQQHPHYVNRAISGQTTYQFLLRFREDVLNLHPKVVILEGGTNDIAGNTKPYNEDYTFGNYLTMIDLCRAHGITPVVCALLPAKHFYWTNYVTDARPAIARMNTRLKKLAEEENLLFIDFFTPLADADGDLNPLYTTDGVHPNRAGYEIMADVFSSHL